MKKLYRSRKNRWLTGLCGGIGEYFDIDPIIIRIIAVLLEFSIVGFIAYFLLSYFVPEQPEKNGENVVESEFKSADE